MKRLLPLAAACIFTACNQTQPNEMVPPVQSDSGVPASSDDAGIANGEDAALPGEDAGLPYYTWWANVRPIVQARCILCHANPPQYGAPRSLVEWSDTQVLTMLGVPVHEMMSFRVNANMNAMPPPTQPQLTAEEKDIIRIWSLIGAPEGEPPAEEDAGVDDQGMVVVENDGGSNPPDAMEVSDAGLPGFSRVLEVLAHNPNSTDPFDIPVANTQYLCWALTVPPTMATEEHFVSVEPVVVNTAHLHHLLLFKNEQGNAADGPFDCGSWDLQWDLVGGWAPGRMTDYLPAGVGVKLEPGQQLVVQAHYDSVTTAGETDQSGFRVTTTDAAGLINAGMLWSGVSWLNAINGANVDHVGTCTINSAITIFSAFPHMHMTGTRITLEVQRMGNQNWTTLVDIDPWSFNDQPNIAIDPAEQMIMPGDKLRTHCWWDTGGRGINFGEASNDEMCFNFIYHYPLMSNAYACWDVAL